MLRKVRMVIVTAFKVIIHLEKVKISGFQDLKFDTKLDAYNKGHIVLGKRTTTFRNVTLAANGGQIDIGNYCFFNRNCIVASLRQISIGNHCIFGPNVVIYDHDHKYDISGIVSGEYKTSPIIIEDNCWIGANVTILRGSHIGEGCVIGAGTVVKGDIPPHSIVRNNRELVISGIREKEDA